MRDEAGGRASPRAETECPRSVAALTGNAAVSTATPYINPTIANLYLNENWRLDAGLTRIFKAANITMSVRMDGRSRKSVVASFHSLRHTFVSLSANAGVPLPVVQSIVGHCSTAMTRHYYHENEDVLRKAVSAIPVIGNGERVMGNGEQTSAAKMAALPVSLTGNAAVPAAGGRASTRADPSPHPSPSPIPTRLRRLSKLLKQHLITEEEFTAQRTRILNEI